MVKEIFVFSLYIYINYKLALVYPATCMLGLVVPRLLGGPLDVEFMQGWREMGPEQRETIRNI